MAYVWTNYCIEMTSETFIHVHTSTLRTKSPSAENQNHYNVPL